MPHLSSQQLRAWRGVLKLQAVLMPKLEAELREETGLTINEEEGRQAVQLALTSAGGHQIRAAMDVRFRGVRRRLVDLLDAEEVELLAKIWARLQAHNAGED
ncbi:hypothetical protein GCM10017744_081830 [Streptomyces antimycoticus]|uniref:MarR family transcriptional regulator n=1 Tax=Streptomyces antimycoticus TaxID=68175 RepID=A0A4D4K1W6_9ACTN|nr:hypothetical protein [Streptomyces antimycoticus]GDY41070.1 hypothetical protein SANT12839_019520 [Streptomyces antimycoticus]